MDEISQDEMRMAIKAAGISQINTDLKNTERAKCNYFYSVEKENDDAQRQKELP